MDARCDVEILEERLRSFFVGKVHGEEFVGVRGGRRYENDGE